jgi:hypothetical protein
LEMAVRAFRTFRAFRAVRAVKTVEAVEAVDAILQWGPQYSLLPVHLLRPLDIHLHLPWEACGDLECIECLCIFYHLTQHVRCSPHICSEGRWECGTRF